MYGFCSFSFGSFGSFGFGSLCKLVSHNIAYETIVRKEHCGMSQMLTGELRFGYELLFRCRESFDLSPGIGWGSWRSKEHSLGRRSGREICTTENTLEFVCYFSSARQRVWRKKDNSSAAGLIKLSLVEDALTASACTDPTVARVITCCQGEWRNRGGVRVNVEVEEM